MDTLSLVIEDRIIVTLTSDDRLPLPDPTLFEVVDEGERVDRKVPSWADLYYAGELDGHRLAGPLAAACGVTDADGYSECFAHITLVDDNLGLWEVRRAAGSDLIGWAVLDTLFCIVDLWQVPANFDLGDL